MHLSPPQILLKRTLSTQTAMSNQNPDTAGNNIPTPETARQAAETSGSRAASCSSCQNWEKTVWPHATSGYCPIFDKMTDEDHGTKCTAFKTNGKDLT